MTSSLEHGRDAFARRAWADVCEAFAAAALEEGALGADDHERVAIAAYLVGADDRCDRAWDAAHRAAVEAGDTAAAARCAVLCALCLVLRGQMAQAGGWIARAERLLDERGSECAASGYVLIPRVLGALAGGDAEGGRSLAVQATDLGTRYADADLRALGVLCHGQALITMGDLDAGLARLDEAMVAVTTGELGPVVTGIVYCAVIVECLRLFDVARAAEWTAALGVWCDRQPDLVPYRGQCLVHRSQIDQTAGRWQEALVAAEAACDRLSSPPHPALGLAHYQRGELHRLVGAFDGAEAAYREASRMGHDPMPGLALLELGRGDTAGAVTAIQRSLAEPRPSLDRPVLLAAAVEIHRAAGDTAAARAAAEELSAAAAASPSKVLRAMAAQWSGTALLSEGEVIAALGELRAASQAWGAVGVPYERARAGVLVGLACAALGDLTAAAVELDNAELVLAELGARPDLERLQTLRRGLVRSGSAQAPALTDREREVLAHLAAGRTNREIAKALTVSPHTVRRHVENIFAKLGVSTRAAATAHAYQRSLLPGGPTG